MKAKDILTAIFRKYSDIDWVCMSEVSNGTGLSRNKTRRADALCMNIWPSKGFVLHGFEIKVSRSDFIKEMEDITKAAEFSKYCDFWWLATPPGLVLASEVPESWGLMECHANGMKIKKQAQKNENLELLDKPLLASMLRKCRDGNQNYIKTCISEEEAKLRKMFEEKIEFEKKCMNERAESIAKWIVDFEEKLGMKFCKWECPKDFATKLKITEVVDAHWLSVFLQQCKDIAQSIEALRSGKPKVVKRRS